MEKNYTDTINILQTQWYQADLDQRFAMGDQDLWGLIFPGVATYRRKIFNFNLINSTLQMTSGYQRRNRKSTICIPINNKNQKTSDQMTKVLYHVHNQSGAYQTYSDCFEQGALTQGLGFLSLYIDKTNDPISGDIKLRNIDMKSCLYDPFFRKHDMSDARFFWTRQFFDKLEAATLYPQFHDEIMSLSAGTYRDDKFYYMPEVYQIQFPNLIAFDEYWYLTSREATFLVDPETEETREFQGDEEELRDAIRLFRSMKRKVQVIKQPKPTYRRAIILNDRVMVDEPNPYKIDRLPIVPMLAYFTPDSPYYSYKFRGQVRDLRDCQYLFNKLKVSNLDILDSQQQGIKMKKGSLVTPDDSLNSGHGRVLSIDPSFQMSDVEHMPIVPPSPVMIQMEDQLQQIRMQISGVNETMLGQDIDSKSGLLSMLRNSAGTTTLTRLFDQFDEAQRLAGDIMVEMVQKNYTYGKIRQIVGEEPTPEFDSKLFLDYGCKVIQGALTETQQQLQLQQLLYFRETTGIPIPSKLIIEASTLASKDELIKAIEEEENAAKQQQQQTAESEMQKMKIESMTKIADVQQKESTANEKSAKIQLDMQRAKHEDTESLLNLVKLLKEIEHLDIDGLMKKVQVVNALDQSINQQLQPQLSTPQGGV
jgi:hypothetical protein